MTPDEREQNRAAARENGAAAPPLSPAQVDHVNRTMRDAIVAVTRRHQKDGDQR